MRRSTPAPQRSLVRSLQAYLEAARTATGLNRAEVSIRATLSESYYGMVEGGKRLPGVHALDRICRVLGLTGPRRTEAFQLLARAQVDVRMRQLSAHTDEKLFVDPAMIPVVTDPGDAELLRARRALDALHLRTHGVGDEWRSTINLLESLARAVRERPEPTTPALRQAQRKVRARVSRRARAPQRS